MTQDHGVAAVRFEGGLGDHILGMRVLRFVRQAHPELKIIAYSDSGGFSAQLEICRMSPFVSEVVPVYKESLRAVGPDFGNLNTLETKYLEQMMSAELFFDCAVRTLHLDTARRLRVSPFDILASRPDLIIPEEAKRRADDLLNCVAGGRFVAMNLAKFGPHVLQAHLDVFHAFLEKILSQPDTVVLNIFAKRQDYPHWPEPQRSVRRESTSREAEILEQLAMWYPGRIVSIVDEPVAVVAAILAASKYYIGVDNGIKHLAWALNIPLSYILIAPPDREFILHWLPDYHRMLLLDGTQDLQTMAAEMCMAIQSGAGEVRHTATADAPGEVKSTAQLVPDVTIES